MNEYDDKGRRVFLQVWYPELPPSTNHIYIQGTRLTQEARTYRESFRQYMQQNYGHQISELIEPNRKEMRNVKEKHGDKYEYVQKVIDVETQEPNLVCSLQLVFYMNCLTTWGDTGVPPSQRAKFRFREVDVSNRIKFVEDCFKIVVGLDDSLTFAATQMKMHSPSQEGVYITYSIVAPEQFGIPRFDGGTL